MRTLLTFCVRDARLDPSARLVFFYTGLILTSRQDRRIADASVADEVDGGAIASDIQLAFGEAVNIDQMLSPSAVELL